MSERWATLNDRQRADRRALYACDQATAIPATSARSWLSAVRRRSAVPA